MRALLAAVLLAGLSGCGVHVKAEPALPFPEIPRLLFKCTGDRPEDLCCLTQTETNVLNRWAKKIREFEIERQRLLKE